MKNLWIKTFPHFARFRPKRSMCKEKRRVLLKFDKEYLQYFFKEIPPRKVSEPTYYTLFIRSNRGKIFSLVFNVLKDLGEDEELSLKVAIAAEILSTNSLIFDDIFDQDKERQGCPTTYIIYGIRNSILSIEYTNSIVFEMNKEEKDVYKFLNEAWIKRLEAFVEEERIKRYKPSLNEYITLAEKISAFGTEFGKFLERRYPGYLTHYLSKFIYYSSLAWVFDDPLLVFREKTEKSLSDIRNGYYNLPIVLLVREMDKTDRIKFEKNFGKCGREKIILDLLKKYKIEQKCKNFVKNFHKKACNYLKKIYNEFSNETKCSLVYFSFVSKTNLRFVDS